ncbi:hypothetical protein D3H55_02665 [Bacillus salacetis]|uniref:Peptidase E n=1 Tax=Bacillus salacetis TaxID=2315464 RepID=A0A3A1R5I3_9BACI|nr:hypothetical protein D3H55_02665 [Bacillus salacetis]
MNQKLHASFKSDHPQIAYIPSSGDPGREYYHNQLNYYKQLGVGDLLLLDITEDLDEEIMGRAMQCDAIHLSGGNPITFRDNLRRTGTDSLLVEYYRRGGTLIGVSGGAVQLGRSTALFDIFQQGLSSASQNWNELGTLNLVPFEFLPHYNRWSGSFRKSVEEYTEKTDALVYAADDGSGIIIQDEALNFIGSIKRIHKGVTEQMVNQK